MMPTATIDEQQPLVLFHNAIIVNEGEEYSGYLTCRGSEITEVGRGKPSAEHFANAAEIHDLGGAWLIPGAIDTHVHFRDPGLTAKGDVASESAQAVAGGVTSYIDMPNTNPATITIEAWENKMAVAAQKSVANYAFYIGATNSNLPTLLAADYTRCPGVKLFLGSSTGNMLVDSQQMLDDLFGKVNALIAVHAESERIIAANRKAAIAKYGDAPVPVAEHSSIRSREACVESAATAVELARRHGARLHLLHLSTADELQLLDPSCPNITAETCPHYLWFDSSMYDTLGSRIKCNPSIKEASDRRALLAAVASGLISTIATDHAPHLPADKEGDALHASSGMPGVRYSLAVMFTLALGGAFTLPTVVQRMCHAPADLFGIERRGYLRRGYYADFAVVKRDVHPAPLTDADAGARCGWTPYVGSCLTAGVAATYVNGHCAYDGEKVSVKTPGMPLRFFRK